jgi:hypothetical protein
MIGALSRRVPAGAALALLLASTLATVASAQDPAPQPRSHISPLTVPAAAFLSDGVDPWDYIFEDGYVQGEGEEVHLVAPVYLPEGAKIRSLRAYIFDSENACDVGDEDVEVFLRRIALADGDVDIVAWTKSLGQSPNVEFTDCGSLSSDFAVVDNHEFAYWLDVKICSHIHRLYSVVIEY